jgi:hypothetical protein
MEQTNNLPQNPPLQQTAVMFSVSDRVYLDSEFGRYEGKVVAIDENVVEIDFETPSGRSSAISQFDLDGLLWKKH